MSAAVLALTRRGGACRPATAVCRLAPYAISASSSPAPRSFINSSCSFTNCSCLGCRPRRVASGASAAAMSASTSLGARTGGLTSKSLETRAGSDKRPPRAWRAYFSTASVSVISACACASGVGAPDGSCGSAKSRALRPQSSALRISASTAVPLPVNPLSDTHSRAPVRAP